MNNRKNNMPELLIRSKSTIAKYVEDGRSQPILRYSRNSHRVERKESRKNISSLLCSFFDCTDLASNYVGIPQPSGDFHYFGVNGIAKKAGFRSDDNDEDDKKLREASKAPKRKGYRTFYRHVAKLKTAGLIVSKFMAGLGRTVYALTNDALRLCGATLETVLHAKHLAKKRQEKRENEYFAKHPNPITKFLTNKLKGAMKVKTPPALPETMLKKILPTSKWETQKLKPKTTEQLDKERKFKLMVAEIKLHPENQHLSLEEFYLKYPQFKELPTK